MKNYEKQAKLILKTEMAKRDIDYPMLSNLLKKIGVNETRENLANKINRGKFSFAFALQILEVLQLNNLNLNNYNIHDDLTLY